MSLGLNPKRSRFGWFDRLRRRWVGDCFRWPSTVRPWQHLACSHALEGSSKPNHHCLHGNSPQTLNPKPYTLDFKPGAFRSLCHVCHSIAASAQRFRETDKGASANPKSGLIVIGLNLRLTVKFLGSCFGFKAYQNPLIEGS